MTKLLSIEDIKTAITQTNELKEVYLEVLNANVFIKKFTRKDSEVFLNGKDSVSSMVYAGVVDDKGERIFESVEQVSDLSNQIVIEMFGFVNKYNNESVEKQAKK